MPAQVEIYAEGKGDADLAYKFLFIAKGGGSANKSFLFQATPSILSRDRLLAFLKDKVLTLGTAACPPYHLAIVIGGTSAEMTMKTVKLASCKYYDTLPEHGSEDGHAFRDREMEAEIQKMTQSLGVGAQFGGKYFCHDVRVIRLPRHGASLPIGLGVSCSADRQALGKITRDGVFLEELEHNPARYLPDIDASKLGGEVVKIDLNRPMQDILAQLSKYPIKTRLSLTGPMIVARDAAHAKLRERLERGEPLPDYFKDHPVVLCRPGENAGGLRLRRIRADHRGPHGFVRCRFPGRRRLDGDAGERQPRRDRARGLQEKRRLLSRLDRRRGGEPRRALHQESRDGGVCRARHGSDLAHRGGRLPGLHRHRRQGQRLLQGIEFGVIKNPPPCAGGETKEVKMQQTAPIRGPLVWRDMDQKTLDDAYNQAAYAPNMDVILGRIATSSEVARKTLGEPQRVAYGPSEHERLDIYRATSASGGKGASAPVNVFVHGGAWLRSSAAQTAFIAEAIVGAGAHAVLIDFINVDQSNGDLMPLAEQVSRAIAWAWSNAESFGGDRNRFFVSAHSSGAHLASCALSRGWRANNLRAGFLQRRAPGQRHVRS